jgi:hypothetical protein
MQFGEKIILLSTKKMYLGIYLGEHDPIKDEYFICYLIFGEWSYQLHKSSKNILRKNDWTKVMTEEQYDKIAAMAISKDPGTRELAKILFYSQFIELKNLKPENI